MYSLIRGWLLALIGLAPFTCFAADLSAQPAPPGNLDLYLLIGQSNMAGRGEVAAEDRKAHPRVWMLDKNNEWKPAVDPLHFDKPIAGVGLGSTFGRVMADKDDKIAIGLIPCAVGGTPLKRWQKGGDLWKQAIARAKAASKDGTLKGVLWHQGESDSGSRETADTYGERLAQLVKDLREELDSPALPFVAGKLGEFLAESDKNGKPSYWKSINEQLDALPKQVTDVAIVDSRGLKAKSDNVHFDAPSLREFGRRYAAAMQSLQQAR